MRLENKIKLVNVSLTQYSKGNLISYYLSGLQFLIWKKNVLIVTQPKKTSLRRLQDVLKRSRRLTTKQDVVTTPGKRRRIYNVLKTSGLRCLENVPFAAS